MKIEPIEQLPAWRTKDGALHLTEESATAHAEGVEAYRLMGVLSEALGRTPDESDVRRVLLKHRVEIEALLAYFHKREA